MSRIPMCSVLVFLAGLAAPAGASAETAAEILRATGVRGGLVVHLGCGDGALTAELGRGDGFLVHGLEATPERVDAARSHIRAQDLYGKVSVDRVAGARLPYADNLVRLVVADDLGGIPMDEVMRVLCPGGVARIGGKTAVKPRPADVGEWTHFRHAADGNMVSPDARIGPPRHTQWISGPIFQRHHGIVPSITTIVASGGRLIYSVDEAPMGLSGMPDQWKLVARDAFSGVLLWKRPFPDWGSRAWSYWTEGHSARFNHPLHVRKRLVASGDRVYATLGFNAPVEALDAATGGTVRTYAGTGHTDEFVLHEGVLYLAVNDKPQKPWDGEGVQPAPPAEPPPPSRKHVWAVEADSGRVLWKAGPFLGNPGKPDRLGSMRHLSVTVGGNGVFLIDEAHVLCLDRETGGETWRVERLARPTPPSKPLGVGDLYHQLVNSNVHAVVHHRDTLYILHPTASSSFKSSGGVLQALDAATGRERWRYAGAVPIAYLEHPDLFAIGDMVWIPDKKAMTLIALDAGTGEVKRKHDIRKALDVGHHHRCYPNRATPDYAILGRRGAEFVDLKTGEVTVNHWARTGCRHGHVPANGILYRPPDHCRCYMAFQPRGFFALLSEKAAGRYDAFLNGGHPLEQGPAYGRVEPPGGASGADWPTFRHDAMRSGAATTPLPAKPAIAWQVDAGDALTPPVVAGGRVFCGTEHDHRVHAFDAASGEPLWSFTAGGRVDSPPTIWNGHAVFGCRDGWVYCLRAMDGALVWRLRAAPGERRIVAFGRLESTWPVHGSVLVAGGTAFFVAGRSSMLDRGVHAFAVDIATGKLLDRKPICEIQTETKTTGALPQGALGDILVSDGEGVYLRNRRLDLAAPLRDVGPAALAATKPRLTADGGFFNRRWFHRAFWGFSSSVGRASGNLIVFDTRRAYVAAANAPGNNNKSFHIPSGGFLDRIIGTDGQGPSWCAHPNLQAGGCILFASSKGEKKSRGDAGKQRDRKKDRRAPKSPAPAQWRVAKYPLCPWAMVVSGDTLVVAGPEDRTDPQDPWAAFEGRAGAQVHVLNADSGETLSRLPIDAPPVWNGMAAADGALFVALRNGRLLRLAAE